MRSAMIVMTHIAWEWGVRCFGWEHMHDGKVRSLRAAEEAIEAAQAIGVDEALLHTLVTTVYKRPRGDSFQELGGMAVTLAVLCQNQGTDIETEMEREITRVLKLTPEHFAKRNQEKLQLGLTGHT